MIFISGADVASLIGAINSSDKDGMFGDSFAWIVMLLIIAGIFGNGFGFGNGAVAAGLTRAEMDSEFIQRDIFNTNTAVLASAGETQKDVLENRYTSQLCCCNTQKEVLTNRYENALATASLQKDILLGNCDIKTAIQEDGEKTRALITANYQASLLEKINDLKAQVSNNEQTGYLLQTMGRWHAYPSCGCGYNCGCSNGLV